MDQSMIKKWQEAAIEQSKNGGSGWTAENTRNVLLAEIALQLAQQNEHNAKIAHALDNLEKSLRSIRDHQMVS